MKFDLSREFPVAATVLWDNLMDVEVVAACMTGAANVTELATDHYAGRLVVKMGPVSLSFDGEVRVTVRDAGALTGKLTATARDGRAGGGFSADLLMQLLPGGEASTTLNLTLESTVLGKIGEFGQPLIRRRIERMLNEFADALTRRLTALPQEMNQ